jgi:hypothetical protein
LTATGSKPRRRRRGPDSPRRGVRRGAHRRDAIARLIGAWDTPPPPSRCYPRWGSGSDPSRRTTWRLPIPNVDAVSTIERSRTRTPGQKAHRSLASRLTGPGWVIMTLACVVIVGVVAPNLTFDPDVYFAEQRENYLRVEFALGVHVLCGMLALLIGPFQFVGRLRRRFVRVHRFCGAVYVASATGIGVTGLILAPTAYTGLVTAAAFTVLDLAMLFTTWTALRMILAGRYGEHRRWMIRSFSLILAGVMLRVWSFLYYGLVNAGLVDFSFETAYAVIAWLCWVPNLLIALWITRQPIDSAPAR